MLDTCSPPSEQTLDRIVSSFICQWLPRSLRVSQNSVSMGCRFSPQPSDYWNITSDLHKFEADHWQNTTAPFGNASLARWAASHGARSPWVGVTHRPAGARDSRGP